MKLFKLTKIHSIRIYILLVLLLAVLFRFYNIHNWLFFGMDQEYQSLIARNIITGKHFPLIGVNAGDTGIYLGPFFSYFAVIPHFLFSGNPLGGALSASLLGIVVSYLLYKIGKEMFSRQVGFFSALFYSSSFLVALYERQFWNPMLIPLFSLLIGYILYRILARKHRELIWLSIIFGLAVQSHLSILIYIPLIFYVVFVRRRDFSKKIIFLSLTLFVLLQTPLILFELRHNFLNSRAAVNILLGKNQSVAVSSFQERSTLFLSTLGRFFWIPVNPDLFLESGQCKELLWLRKDAYPEGILLVLSGIVIFIVWYLRKGRRKRYLIDRSSLTHASKIVVFILLLTFIFIEFYSRQIFEYYLLFFFPWLAIALGRSLDFFWQKEHGKALVIPIIFVFISLNLLTLFTANFSYSYKDKIAAINFSKRFVTSGGYSLEALGECPRFGGYRYLFEHLVGPPEYSYMDSYFKWLYPETSGNYKLSRIILLSMIDPRNDRTIITKWEEIKLQFLTRYKTIAEKRMGQINVFILELQNL